MSTGTVRFHRVLTAPPERVYRAFLDADAMAKWLPPHGFTGHVHKMDARVGGSYRMSFTNFSSGKSHAFGGTYLELVPHERLRYTATFDDPNLPGHEECPITSRDGSHQVLFIEVPDVKQAKNRIHFDLRPVEGTRDDELARLVELGAKPIDDLRKPDGTGWVTLADPEGNEFCVSPSAG